MAKEKMLVYHKDDFSEKAMQMLALTVASGLAPYEPSNVVTERVAQQVTLRRQEGIWQEAVAGKVPSSFAFLHSAEQGLGKEYGVERYTTFAPLLVWHPNITMLQIVSKNLVLEAKTLAVLFARTDITDEQRDELMRLQRSHYGSIAGFDEVVAEAKIKASAIRDRLLLNERRDDFFVNYQRKLVRSSLAA